MDPWPPWPSHCTSSHPSWLHLMATLSTAYRAVHAQQLPDSFGAALALTPFASLTGISFVNPYNTTCTCCIVWVHERNTCERGERGESQRCAKTIGKLLGVYGAVRGAECSHEVQPRGMA